MPPWSVKMSQNKKTNLTFKLVGVTKSSPAVCLQNQEEWQDLIRAVEEAEMKGAKGAMNIWSVKRYIICHYSTPTN